MDSHILVQSNVIGSAGKLVGHWLMLMTQCWNRIESIPVSPRHLRDTILAPESYCEAGFTTVTVC